MRKIFKWIGIVLGTLVGLFLVLAAILYFKGSARLNKTYSFPADNIVIPTDASSIEVGKHLTETLCTHCHTVDLSGKTWFSFPPAGTVDSANLTSGEGGIGQEFKIDEDYVRAIRHGVDPEGKPIFMPSVAAFQDMSDQDLAAVIAYLKTIPPVDHKTNGKQFTPLAKIMIGAGIIPLPVESVKHNTHVSAPAAGVTTEYGQYLVTIGGCRDCHGQNLAGGPYPQPGVSILVPNITPGGEPGLWTEDQFFSTIRTGVTPGGHTLNPEYMPWPEVGKSTDNELKAIWLYLQSIPKLPSQTK
jgi:mono/diheme cytochrome c family protein